MSTPFFLICEFELDISRIITDLNEKAEKTDAGIKGAWQRVNKLIDTQKGNDFKFFLCCLIFCRDNPMGYHHYFDCFVDYSHCSCVCNLNDI